MANPFIDRPTTQGYAGPPTPQNIPPPPDKPATPESPPPPGLPPPRSGFRIETWENYYQGIGGDVAESVKGNKNFQVNGNLNQINVGNVQAWVYGHKFESINGTWVEHCNGLKFEEVFGPQVILNFVDLNNICMGVETRTNGGGIIETLLGFRISTTVSYEKELNPLHKRKIAAQNQEMISKSSVATKMKCDVALLKHEAGILKEIAGKTIREIATLDRDISQIGATIAAWSQKVDGDLEVQSGKIENVAGAVKLALTATAMIANSSVKVVAQASRVTICATNLVVMT